MPTLTLTAGANAPLPAPAATIALDWHGDPPGAADPSAFVLDATGRVRGDADFIFYNQPADPAGGVRLVPPDPPARAAFRLQLDALPADVARVVFAVTAGAGTTCAQLDGLALRVISAGQTLHFAPDPLGQERALILGAVYRHATGWKFRAVGQGFNGGLGPLAMSFGVDIATATPEQRAAACPRVLSLVKTARISLEKRQLQQLRARVGLVLDASGSMRRQYREGRVQDLLDRLLALALHFDDDGAVEVWAFDDVPHPLPPATADNSSGYVETVNGGWRRWSGGANNEPPVLRLVIDHYQRDPHGPPAYILFVSDGGISKNAAIRALLTEASALPLFWQFLGLGGRNYGILESLDTLGGRVVDNCGFFAIDDLSELSDAALYDRMLRDFPKWMTAARAKGIV